jgi:hypothetical protein
MASWTVFYVNEADEEKVVDALSELSGISKSAKGSNPKDLHEHRLYDGDTPSYLVVGKTQNDWTTVRHNSLDELKEWGILISQKFSTKVIVTLAQSASSYYYFSLYENGEKIREIAACYSEDSELLDVGNRFPFEGEKPGEKKDWDDEPTYYFGFESIETYCRHFGLEIQSDYEKYRWTILKGETKNSPTNEIVNRLLLANKKKPWWRFWN